MLKEPSELLKMHEHSRLLVRKDGWTKFRTNSLETIEEETIWTKLYSILSLIPYPEVSNLS